MPRNPRHEDEVESKLGRGTGVGRQFAGAAADYRGDYDPAQFIIPASDAKGHSEREWFRTQPGHDRQADIILRSKRFPFKTKGDLIRWCFVVGMERLLAMEDIDGHWLMQCAAMNEILRDEMYQQDFMATFEAMSRVVSKHQEMGATGEVRRLVSDMLNQVRKMPDGYWRDKFIKEIDDKFGHYLDGKGVRLGRGSGGDGAA
jgi:hypothetical protein